MKRHAAVVGALIALLGVSCGSSGSKAASTTVSAPNSTVPATTSTSAATATTDPALAAKAAAAVLQPADFPAAFKGQDDKGGDCPASSASCSSLSLEAIWHDLTTCLAVDDSHPAAIATSPTYLQGLATQARSTVEYTTASSASAISTALTGPQSQGCLTSAFNADAKRSAPPGATPSPVVVAPLDTPLVGQKVSATRITAAMSMQNMPIKINQDFIVVFNGTTVTRLFFLNPGSPFPPTLEQSLVQKVVGRA